MLHAFLYGVILAFGLIMPLGMQNIFIFNQGAMQRHFMHALPSVIAASICDTVLILCSVLGVSLVVLTIPWLKVTIFAIGFCFLIYMGWMTWKSAPPKLEQGQKPLSAKRQVGFALSVSLLNPHAIIDSLGVIGTGSLHFTGSAKVAYTAACILVSCTWFFGLSVTGHYLHKLDKSGIGLRLINKLSALIIWGVALYIAWQLVLAAK